MYARNLKLRRRELKYFKTVRLRFYAELNNFLPAELRQIPFDYSFPGPIIVREVIESMKIPLTEVDLILVNGEAVDFNYPVQDGDFISVYPVFEQFDITDLTRLRKTPLRSSQFIVDSHLGKLAKYLRMSGFDTLYENDYADAVLRRIANEQNRIILTRDRDLLTSREVTHGYYVRTIDPHAQLAEIVSKFDLYSQINPFSRCLVCNSALISVSREEIKDMVEKQIIQIFQEFYKCPQCHKIYWKGSHYEHMMEFIKSLGK